MTIPGTKFYVELPADEYGNTARVVSFLSRAAAFLSGITAYGVETAAEWTQAVLATPGAIAAAAIHATETTGEQA